MTAVPLGGIGQLVRLDGQFHGRLSIDDKLAIGDAPALKPVKALRRQMNQEKRCCAARSANLLILGIVDVGARAFAPGLPGRVLLLI